MEKKALMESGRSCIHAGPSNKAHAMDSDTLLTGVEKKQADFNL